ncbi:MAG: class B sortase [Bacilli bacterium]|nr:class B sortase [Bacilli bacterium]
MKKILTALYILLFISIAVFCFYKAYEIKDEQTKIKEEQTELIDIAEIPEKVEDIEEKKEVINFQDLININSDFIGWIKIEDTNINYPIVQGTNNTYYLKHSFYKEYSNAGSIYMDATANSNFSSKNTFIYGHYTSDGSMFGQIGKYMKQDFYDKHKEIYIYTSEQNYKLEVFSVHVDKASSKSYQMNFTTDESYKDYIDLMKSYSVIKSDIEIDYTEDRIVTLYSCSHERGHAKDDRYFVHAKLIEI